MSVNLLYEKMEDSVTSITDLTKDAAPTTRVPATPSVDAAATADANATEITEVVRAEAALGEVTEEGGFAAVATKEAVAAYLCPDEAAENIRQLCGLAAGVADDDADKGTVSTASAKQIQETALTALLLHLHSKRVSFPEVLSYTETCIVAATKAATTSVASATTDCTNYVKAAQTRKAAAALPAQILQRMPELPLRSKSSSSSKGSSYTDGSSGCRIDKSDGSTNDSSSGDGERLSEDDALWQLLLQCSDRYMTDWQGTEGGASCCLAVARSSPELLQLLLPPPKGTSSDCNSNDSSSNNSRKYWTEDCTVGLFMLRSLLHQVHTPSFAQSTRQLLLQLLLLLLQECAKAVQQEMRREALVLEISRQLEGERDPRCLLLLFAIVKELGRTYSSLMRESELEASVDLIMSYFPVSFSPPPNAVACVTGQFWLAVLGAAVGCYCCCSSWLD